MESVNYVSLSVASALRRSMDTTAHNIANASTFGYKSSQSLHEAVQQDGPAGPDESISYVRDNGTYVDTSQGALVQTNNPLDVSISGPGWFGFATEGGQVAYGRDGRFAVTTQGQMVTMSGVPVVDPNGAPINIPPEVAGELVIAQDGTLVSPEGDNLGQIGIFQVNSVNAMTAIGGGMFLPPVGAEAAGPDETSQLMQGYLEQSNVQPVIEMTRLVDIQRAYERAVKLMGEDNDLTKQLIQRLGRAV